MGERWRCLLRPEMGTNMVPFGSCPNMRETADLMSSECSRPSKTRFRGQIRLNQVYGKFTPVRASSISIPSRPIPDTKRHHFQAEPARRSGRDHQRFAPCPSQGRFDRICARCWAGLRTDRFCAGAVEAPDGRARMTLWRRTIQHRSGRQRSSDHGRQRRGVHRCRIDNEGLGRLVNHAVKRR